jgi:iron complex transport system permease protein
MRHEQILSAQPAALRGWARSTWITVPLFAAVLLAALAVGPREIALLEIPHLLLGGGELIDRLVLLEIRLPRAVAALLVGASLGIAGTLLQGMTGNPLAGPHLLGVNNGAALGLALGSVVLGLRSPLLLQGLAFAGAAVTAFAVFVLAARSRWGARDARLLVIGAAVSVAAWGVSLGILLLDHAALEEIRFWLAGAVWRSSWGSVLQALPGLTAGCVASLLLIGPLEVYALGEAQAQGLGQRVALIRTAAIITVVLLAGTAITLAGPVAFVGLMAPHAAGFLSGRRTLRALGASALIGGTLVLASDAIGRLLVQPEEIPLSVGTTLIGAPFLLWLIRRRFAR